MRRVPLLSGSRIVHVPLRDDDVVLRPPPLPTRVVDVEAAVRDALRFPLDGPPLEELAQRRGRVTVVVEPPALPLPGAQADPRREALATVLAELAARGVPDERQTLLVAGGLVAKARAAGPRAPPCRRRRRARTEGAWSCTTRPTPTSYRSTSTTARRRASAASCSTPTSWSSSRPPRPSCTEGRQRSSPPATPRRSGVGPQPTSLVQAAGEPVWELALGVEDALRARVPLLGVSLALDHPRLTGRFRDYPFTPASLTHVSTSPLRRIYSALPAGLRREILRGQHRALVTAAVFAGTPSVAHAEALVRAVELRGIDVEEPLDALVVGVPWIGPHVPREPLNPVTSAAVVLGHALRLWRDAFPVRDGRHARPRPLADADVRPRRPRSVSAALRRPHRG